MEEVSDRRTDLEHLHNTQHSHETGGHVSDGIRTRNHTKPAASDLGLRPCGHWKLCFPSTSRCQCSPVSTPFYIIYKLQYHGPAKDRYVYIYISSQNTAG